jgi:hypothetical protein
MTSDSSSDSSCWSCLKALAAVPVSLSNRALSHPWSLRLCVQIISRHHILIIALLHVPKHIIKRGSTLLKHRPNPAWKNAALCIMPAMLLHSIQQWKRMDIHDKRWGLQFVQIRPLVPSWWSSFHALSYYDQWNGEVTYHSQNVGGIAANSLREPPRSVLSSCLQHIFHGSLNLVNLQVNNAECYERNFLMSRSD